VVIYYRPIWRVWPMSIVTRLRAVKGEWDWRQIFSKRRRLALGILTLVAAQSLLPPNTSAQGRRGPTKTGKEDKSFAADVAAHVIANAVARYYMAPAQNVLRADSALAIVVLSRVSGSSINPLIAWPAESRDVIAFIDKQVDETLRTIKKGGTRSPRIVSVTSIYTELDDEHSRAGRETVRIHLCRSPAELAEFRGAKQPGERKDNDIRVSADNVIGWTVVIHSSPIAENKGPARAKDLMVRSWIQFLTERDDGTAIADDVELRRIDFWMCDGKAQSENPRSRERRGLK
jgi:hypothetical protein